ncbi:MAG: RlmE family RNA methyltransferase [Nitrososphaerota archaeon]|nr:RlmE family RNA methyltransferase [Nitrososphaerota archaeon]MDG6975593.1 RlmE family RNA methyltransferase [Nitrososphaerota archaeon]MDG7010455.1 RlmE family RNA methyltransferase [Nitrososphaerota archaeon]MDG7015909.1 RlmE family RNA methyltransferase [Nitrososphaerota archaeon]MDG7020042.1 RlmE family RNA methyltransferase [Nitrososphaerota archaeon]
MRLNEARRDLYRRLAREQGYKSRAAFKLIEANERYDFVSPGAKVVDFGAAPGGWTQVASELVGPQGFVVGVDRAPIRVKLPNVAALKMDVEDPGVPAKVLDLLKGRADVVLSDIAPTVTGVWELDQTRQVDLTLKVLDICGAVLKEGGSAFFKLFEGERSQDVRDRFRATFASVRVIKPAASRNASSELYYHCQGPKQRAP